VKIVAAAAAADNFGWLGGAPSVFRRRRRRMIPAGGGVGAEGSSCGRHGHCLWPSLLNPHCIVHC